MSLPDNPVSAKAKTIFFLSVILALAMFLRLGFVKDYTKTSVFPVLEQSDSYSYLLWARDIACGGGLIPDFSIEKSAPGVNEGPLGQTRGEFGRFSGVSRNFARAFAQAKFGIKGKAFMKWPLYAYFLSFLLRLFRDNIALVYLFQYVLGSLNCALVYLIARRIFDERAAFISALLCGCYGLFVFYDSLLVYTTLSLFLNSLLFLFILAIKDRAGRKNLFLLGVLLGICVLTQASIAVFGVISVLWILKNRPAARRSRLYNFSFFLLGLFIVVGPVTLRNYLAEKGFVLIAGNTGFNFYSGNNPEATGTFFCPDNISCNQQDMFRDARITADIETGKRLNTQGVSAFWFGRAMGFIRSHPFRYLKLMFRKLVFALGPREFVHDMEYRLIYGKIGVFKIMFSDLRFILPFALLGMFTAQRKSKDAAFLYIALFSLSASIVLFFVTARYRIIAAPYLMIFAGLGIIDFRRILKERRFLLLGAALAVFLFLSFYSAGLENRDARAAAGMKAFDSHFFAAMDYKNNSRFKEAIRELDFAHRALPGNMGPLLQEAGIYFRLNDYGAAQEKLKQALQVNPFSVDAYYNLGLIYNREKKGLQAKDMLQRAVFLDPENVEAHFELGMACKQLRDKENAGKEFVFVLKKLSCWRKEERRIAEEELAALEK